MLIYKRLLITLAMLILSVNTLAAPTDIIQEIAQLQTSIDNDIKRLRTAKGELIPITEYRINSKSEALREHIKTLLADESTDKAYLQSLIENQLAYLTRVGAYLDNDITRLIEQLGTSKDKQTSLLVSKRELERDNYLKRSLETLDWAEKIGLDISNERASLTTQLQDRADRLDSLVGYTQEQLKQAVNDATIAAKDVTSEQTARVLELKERLSQNSQSLSITVSLLDSLEQNTSAFKKTLFSISGDITQDVLNFDVASGLLEQWLDTAQHQSIENGPKITFKIFIFILILFIASLAGKLVKKVVRNTVSNSKLKFSKLLQDFFTSLSGKAVFTLGLLIALSQLGFELGPLLAGFGIAGVIIGFALQDTLSNFASGMMILIYRPYDVGDLINAAGVTGRVSHMSLVSTTIKTLDNQRLIIPNNKIWGDTINNITAEHQRRVDMTFGISYSDNIEHAETILSAIVNAHPKVNAEPKPTVKLHLLGESSVDFIVRPWVKPEDYWDVYWDITREVKMRFDAEGISIPFPQRDVHIYQTK